MSSTLDWDPPGPGPWQQDSAHNPVAQTALLQQAYPAGFNRGFEEAFGGYGVLLDRLAMASDQRVHLPPAAAVRPAGSGRAQGPRVDRRRVRPPRRRRRAGVRGPHLARGDAPLGRGAEAGVGRPPPRRSTWTWPRSTTRSCRPTSRRASSHVTEMVYQHHRHNSHALVPVGDFLLQAAGVDRSTAGDACCRSSTATRRCRAWWRPEMRPALDALAQGRRGTRAALLRRRPRRRARSPAGPGARGGGVHRRGALPPARGLRRHEPHHRRAAGRPRRAPADRARRRPRRGPAAVGRDRGRAPGGGARGAPGGVRRPAGRGPARVPPARRARHLQRDLGDRAPAARPARARPPPPAAGPGAGGRGRARGRASTSSRRSSPEPTRPRPRSCTSGPSTASTRTRAGAPRFLGPPPPAAAAGRHAPAAAGPGDVGDRVPHRRHPRPEGGARG